MKVEMSKANDGGQASGLRQHVGELSETLQTYAIPWLPAPTVAALRSTCRGFRDMVDSTPSELLAHAMEELLPPTLLEQAADGTALLQMLKQQQNLLFNLSLGELSGIESTFTHRKAHAKKLLWSPAWPCRYLAIVMKSSAEYFAPELFAFTKLQQHAAHHWLHVLDLSSTQPFVPIPFADTSLCTWSDNADIRWMSWCADAQHLCFEQWKGQQQIIVMDVQGSISVTAMLATSPILPAAEACARTGVLLVPRPSHVALVDMVTLEEKAQVSAPEAALSSLSPDLSPSWLGWSPDSKLFAVAWGPYGQEVMALTVHNAAGAGLVGYLNVQRGLGVEDIVDGVFFRWSPCSSYLLLAQPESWDLDDIGFNAIIDVTGRFCWMSGGSSEEQNVAGFSPDGRFLHVIAQMLKLREDDDDAWVPSISGCIFEVRTGRRILSWEEEYGDFGWHQIVWASRATACYLRATNTIFTWRSGCNEYPSLAQPFAETQYFQCQRPPTLSPCGRLFVGGSRVSGSHIRITTPFSWDENGFNYFPDVDVCQLWHSTVQPCSTGCSMQTANEEGTEWAFDSIAWHPSPLASHVYVISNISTGVHLMDGLAHKPIICWPWDVIFPAGPLPPKRVALQWSPDGSQLAVVAEAFCASILCLRTY